jgi:hypothetical protein
LGHRQNPVGRCGVIVYGDVKVVEVDSVGPVGGVRVAAVAVDRIGCRVAHRVSVWQLVPPSPMELRAVVQAVRVVGKQDAHQVKSHRAVG